MKNKKAQSQIMTTVLIILLVLAIIIIVWQVVNKAVGTGTEKIEAQEKCLGVLMEVTQPDSNNDEEFIIKRTDSNQVEEGVSLVILVDGKGIENTDYSFVDETMNEDEFKNPFTSAKIRLSTPAEESVEVALKIGNTVCSSPDKIDVI